MSAYELAKIRLDFIGLTIGFKFYMMFGWPLKYWTQMILLYVQNVKARPSHLRSAYMKGCCNPGFFYFVISTDKKPVVRKPFFCVSYFIDHICCPIKAYFWTRFNIPETYCTQRQKPTEKCNFSSSLI